MATGTAKTNAKAAATAKTKAAKAKAKATRNPTSRVSSRAATKPLRRGSSGVSGNFSSDDDLGDERAVTHAANRPGSTRADDGNGRAGSETEGADGDYDGDANAGADADGDGDGDGDGGGETNWVNIAIVFAACTACYLYTEHLRKYQEEAAT